jgi:outer membrane protein OmpA-like peptidoglycan-associated protein
MNSFSRADLKAARQLQGSCHGRHADRGSQWGRFFWNPHALFGLHFDARGERRLAPLAWNLHRPVGNERIRKDFRMNRHQQRVSLLFGLLMISAALLGRANSLEAQTLAEHGAGAAHESDDGLVLTLGDVVFDAGKATLQSSAVTAIDRLAQLLNVYPERSVRIEGHTDSVGDAAANQALSERRAAAVRDALLARGVDAARVEAVGFGATHPVADNRTESGRQKNRRIDIVLSGEQPTASGDGVAHNAQ